MYAIDPGDTGAVIIGEPLVELSTAGEGSYRMGYSGDALNMAISLARLGAPARLATAVGTSSLSEALLELLRDEGIDTALIHRDPMRELGLYLIDKPAAHERRVIYWRDSSAARHLLSGAGLHTCLSSLPEGAVVIASAICLAVMGNQGREILFGWLRARPAPALLFDTNLRPRLWPDLATARAAMTQALSYATLVSASQEDLALVGVSDCEAMLRDSTPANAELVIRSSDLSIRTVIGGRCEIHEAPASKVEVVDATGAGDAFNAAYLAARRVGANARAAVEAGRRLANLVIAQPSAVLPRRDTPSLRSLLA